MSPPPAAPGERGPPDLKKRGRRGPAVMMTVFPPWTGSMASNLSQWFVYCIIVSVFAAYIGGSAVPPGAPTFAAICRYVGVTAFAGYTLALWQMSIWYRRAWSMTLKSTLDGVVYALVTCAGFTWMWPH